MDGDLVARLQRERRRRRRPPVAAAQNLHPVHVELEKIVHPRRDARRGGIILLNEKPADGATNQIGVIHQPVRAWHKADGTQATGVVVQELNRTGVVDVDGVNFALNEVGEEIAILQSGRVSGARIHALRPCDCLYLVTCSTFGMSECAKRRREVNIATRHGCVERARLR
jgi:hypothetical protein